VIDQTRVSRQTNRPSILSHQSESLERHPLMRDSSAINLERDVPQVPAARTRLALGSVRETFDLASLPRQSRCCVTLNRRAPSSHGHPRIKHMSSCSRKERGSSAGSLITGRASCRASVPLDFSLLIRFVITRDREIPRIARVRSLVFLAEQVTEPIRSEFN